MALLKILMCSSVAALACAGADATHASGNVSLQRDAMGRRLAMCKPVCWRGWAGFSWAWKCGRNFCKGCSKCFPTPTATPAPTSQDTIVIRIHESGDNALNLAEVEALDEGGNKIDALSAQILPTGYYWGAYPAEKCIDGQESNFCHSGENSAVDYYLDVFYAAGSSIHTISVTNRRDCCGHRIVGGTIQMLVNGQAQWADTFDEELAEYAFYPPQAPGPSATFPPTPTAPPTAAPPTPAPPTAAPPTPAPPTPAPPAPEPCIKNRRGWYCIPCSVFRGTGPCRRDSTVLSSMILPPTQHCRKDGTCGNYFASIRVFGRTYRFPPRGV
jgi:hypothetical protein